MGRTDFWERLRALDSLLMTAVSRSKIRAFATRGAAFRGSGWLPWTEEEHVVCMPCDNEICPFCQSPRILFFGL